MDGKEFSWELDFGRFHTATLMGISTMNLTDGLMDRTGDRHTDGQMDLEVESHLG